ncbi:HlyD family efflux transporter periplasmic adaptor subunit [Zunongwangia sp. F363]|uniref:HlyD family efflux transporter periplasmic adaptor subunit n=1 Tax=Autumnicola tepida TaxID=3075595 RepID=A0ABU3C7A1_9FLAO|nr:HlyD family efflux transporter periplasmic adaptor subunit [Zunongwangia sp. F363]MDT0642219.1 HlyD family efflux transporter periplasmic adaptor subunit [Zunongwangia sp. F363]
MKIFPKEIIENTAEVFKFRHTIKSKIIYSIFLIAILVALISLPFINVDVYTSSAGIVKPAKDRIIVSTINAGRIQFSALEDNKEVIKGDTLLIIESKIIDEQLEYSNSQSKELELFIRDLEKLASRTNINFGDVESAKYQADFLEYKQKLRKLQTRLQQLQLNFERNKSLFEKGVIAAAEFESIQAEYNLALSDISSFKKQQKNSWQKDLITYKDALEELYSNRNQLIENKSHFYITAPTSGVLMNTTQFSKGSYISPGTKISEISPDTNLIAECYISPADIGLIDPKKRVIFQIDAYNYNQWGLADGEIVEISKDIELSENKPVFKIRCLIKQEHLSLKNGVEGKIKKGMTLNARFILAERSLYQLLYDNVDDWLNPANT